jgi:bis(5'-adenosyl)-triphosphatase
MDNTTYQPEGNCLFCTRKIIEKSFYTTAQFSALYNIAPILPGHSLIIPNKHYESVFELSDDELGEMMCFARRATQVLKSVFKCDGFDWSLQDGVSAGQTVLHLHVHIIPRKAHDLPDGHQWYRKIAQNEKQMLDSQHRERLSDHDYNAITNQLIEASATIRY